MSEPVPAHLGHGISVIPLPLPFPRLRWVNAYLVEGDEGLVMIDAGVETDESRQAWLTGMEALGHDPAAVTTLVVTHLHPDHVGMAETVVDASGARCVMHEAAIRNAEDYADWSRFRTRVAAEAARHGAPPEAVVELGADDPRPPWAPPTIPKIDPVVDGDVIAVGTDRTLGVIHTPGHEEAHICLLDSRTGVLFSGDHILPRITPVVTWDPDGSDRLGTYLESLLRIERMDLGLTYPAHGGPIASGSLRARQIALHHERRLGAILQELREGPRTAWQVMEAIFRPNLMPLEKRMAFGETLAHLEHLRFIGEVERFEEDGVYWYRRVPRSRRTE